MDPLESLLDALSGRRLLLVVDNAEHVLSQSADVVRRIVRAVPEVSVLVTSREPLGVQGERIWSVPPLDVSHEAVELFCERAQFADAEFDPSEQRDAIEVLCNRLDGIPLAIELAAARVRSMTPQELVERIGDRFRLLRDARTSDRSERHQTLRAALDWSHRLLTDTEQQFFDRLSVFTGTFDANAAMAVCAPPDADEFDVIDLLSGLVDKSLVTAVSARGRTRYSLLETMRQFGWERLSEREEISAMRSAHCRYYVAAAERSRVAYEGNLHDDGAASFIQDWDNLRSAFEWAESTGDSDQVGRLVQSTFWFCWYTIRDEHADWALRATRLTNPAPEVEAASSWWLRVAGDYERAMLHATQGLERAGHGEHPRAALALAGKAYVLWFVGKPENSWEAVRAADRAAGNGEDRFLASHLAALAGAMGITADPANAYSYALRSRAIAAPLQNPTADAWSSFVAGGALFVNGDITRSRVEYDSALDLAAETNNRFVEGLALMMMAIRSLDAGWPDTVELYRKALTRLHADGARAHIWTLIGALTDYWITTGHPEPAAVALGALANHDPIGNSSVANRRHHAEQSVEQHPNATEWIARGNRMTREELITYALDHLHPDSPSG